MSLSKSYLLLVFAPFLCQTAVAQDPLWTQIAPPGPVPGARLLPSAVIDPAENQLLVYGGSGTSGPLSDVWRFAGGTAPGWSLLSPAGTAPSARFGHSAIYDAAHSQMTVF